MVATIFMWFAFGIMAFTVGMMIADVVKGKRRGNAPLLCRRGFHKFKKDGRSKGFTTDRIVNDPFGGAPVQMQYNIPWCYRCHKYVPYPENQYYTEVLYEGGEAVTTHCLCELEEENV